MCYDHDVGPGNIKGMVLIYENEIETTSYILAVDPDSNYKICFKHYPGSLDQVTG